MYEFDKGPDLRAFDYYADDHSVLRYAGALAAKRPGVALEFGVGNGTSLAVLSMLLPVIGFDSFQGLPEDWREGYPKGHFASDKVPDVENTTIVTGLFEDTLPIYDWPEEVALIHFDADVYSSTATALAHTAEFFKPGLVVVFDEFFGYEGDHEHEQKAWFEFLVLNDIAYKTLGHGREQIAFEVVE